MYVPEKKSRPWAIIIGLSLSSVLHVCALIFQIALPALPPPEEQPLAIVLSELPQPAVTPPSSPEAVVAEEAPKIKKAPPPSKEKQVAETEDAGNREEDPEAKYLSDRSQRAEKETKSKNVDDFRKKEGTGQKQEETETAKKDEPEPAPASPDSSEVVAEAEKDPEGVMPTPKGSAKAFKDLTLKDLSIGGDGSAAAATDDRLAGVDAGERTILSTREFRYFAYYHRIKELLRQHWKPNVERKLNRLWGKGKSVSDDEMVTKVLVLLDDRGLIQKISRLSGSGFNELDEAAVEAFQKAAPFPNPPKGMMDADGLVRIRWDFILRAEAAPKIQFRTVGANPR